MEHRQSPQPGRPCDSCLFGFLLKSSCRILLVNGAKGGDRPGRRYNRGLLCCLLCHRISNISCKGDRLFFDRSLLLHKLIAFLVIIIQVCFCLLSIRNMRLTTRFPVSRFIAQRIFFLSKTLIAIMHSHFWWAVCQFGRGRSHGFSW
jgi:hypothetical protein